jgi:hypothetical protein
MSDETNTVKHTPEPWIAEPYRVGPGGSTGCGIVSTPRPGHGFGVFRAPRFARREQWEADSARATACVNACKGINPEAVPDLLRAVKIAEKSLDGQWRLVYEFRDMDRDEAIGALRGMFVAAIAKAEGGAE